jgi:hypothetical protein
MTLLMLGTATSLFSSRNKRELVILNVPYPCKAAGILLVYFTMVLVTGTDYVLQVWDFIEFDLGSIVVAVTFCDCTEGWL